MCVAVDPWRRPFPDKGKPAARRGRKATGQAASLTAGLPKKGLKLTGTKGSAAEMETSYGRVCRLPDDSSVIARPPKSASRCPLGASGPVHVGGGAGVGLGAGTSERFPGHDPVTAAEHFKC